MKQSVRKLMGYIFKTVLVVILCLNLFTILTTAADLRDRLSWLPYAALTVETGSMEPQYSQGDMVIIKEVDFSQLGIGDDVTYMDGDSFVTHRIIGREGDAFITRGIANDIEDKELLTRDTYCGRVAANVPGMGKVVDWVTESKLVVIILMVIAGCLCFGRKIVNFLYKVIFHDRAPGARLHFDLQGRVLLCLALLTSLMTLPLMTEAKYTTDLKRHETAAAKALYFSSNYLSTGTGNTYSIMGWNGENYSLNLQIKNSDNALLFNDTGMDVTYSLGIRMITTGGNSSAYTVSVTPPNEAKRAATESFQYPQNTTWSSISQRTDAYVMEGGTKNTDTFVLTITPTDTLPAKTKIQFEVFACTSEQDNYFVELKGSFRLQVAESSEFIGSRKAEDNGSLVTLNVTTNLINEGVDEKLVAFRWDPSKLYINEYERTAFSVINSDPTLFNKDEGILYMRLQAYSRVYLEFFKKADIQVNLNDFVIQIVDDTSVKPPLPVGNPAESDPGTETP